MYTQMIRWGQVEASEENEAAVRSTYRPDLYRAALGRIDSDIPSSDLKAERFFDGRGFDPEILSG
jgi:NitT/TauT family transport system ATP-binding protein